MATTGNIVTTWRCPVCDAAGSPSTQFEMTFIPRSGRSDDGHLIFVLAPDSEGAVARHLKFHVDQIKVWVGALHGAGKRVGWPDIVKAVTSDIPKDDLL